MPRCLLYVTKACAALFYRSFADKASSQALCLYIAHFMFAGFSTGVKWAVSLDSTPFSAQAHSLAAGRSISCAVPGSTLLHWLPSDFGVHQHSCGLPVRYAGFNALTRDVAQLAPICK